MQTWILSLVVLLQGCALVPHMLAAAPGIRLDDKPKVVYVAKNIDNQKPIKPAKPEDSCYRYVDPNVENPGAMKFGCEDYVKKYKGKVQR